MPAVTAADDAAFEIWLGRVLRAGVLIAAGIVACGGAVYLRRRTGLTVDYHAFRGEPEDLRSVNGIFAEARALSGRGLIQLGLLVLIGTPVARVLCSVVGFLRERDWTYAGITMVVLLLLIYSLTAA